MDQPPISSISLWENYKQDVLFVIRESLLFLQKHPNLPTVEQSSKNPSLNRTLYRYMRRVCNKRPSLVYHLPTYEGQNLPDQSDQPAQSETKRPDFYWHIANHLDDDDQAELRFVLECKRLGMPERSAETFNECYVLKGICRFLAVSHEYGKGDNEGGMIGYIQSMEFADILEEINQIVRQCSIKVTQISPPPGGWVEDGISELEQVLERSFPVSPFLLRHFWVDIRKE